MPGRAIRPPAGPTAARPDGPRAQATRQAPRSPATVASGEDTAPQQGHRRHEQEWSGPPGVASDRLVAGGGLADSGWPSPAFAVKVASLGPGVAALNIDRYDAGTVTALLDLNDSAVDLSWALDDAFVLLLGLGAVAVRALPGWLAGLTVAAGTAVLVGVAVTATFDLLQLVFLVWLLVTSGWLLARGNLRTSTAPALA